MSEVPTHKQIAKFIKGRGYGKQHLYCQLCRKQTRSENAFKQHVTSDKHVQRALEFAKDPEGNIQRWSDDFEKGMLNVMRTTFSGQSVPITTVHHKYITARSHTRLNGTKWETLDDFAKYLGKSGKAEVAPNPTGEGLFVKYRESEAQRLTPQEIERRARLKQLQSEEQMLKNQMAAAAQSENNTQTTSAPSEIDLDKMKDFKFTFKVTKPASITSAPTKSSTDGDNPLNDHEEHFDEEEDDEEYSSDEDEEEPLSEAEVEATPITEMKTTLPTPKLASLVEEPKLTVKRKLDEKPINGETEPSAKKVAKPAGSGWLVPGIVVKVINKQLGDGKYYKQKGVVDSTADAEGKVGIIKMFETGHRLKLDRSQLETVIPNIGGTVLIVKGKRTGKKGIVKSLNEKKFCVEVELLDNHEKIWEEYDNICKLNQ